MANDITTLAIALQSKEAEASMQTFNSLLETGSKNAKNMENMRIGVDVDEALRQLTAFKQSYEDIAKTAQSIHFDLGMNMPAAITPPPVQASGIDTSALQEIKAFFEQSAEEMRRQSEALNESMEKMGSGSKSAGQSIRVSGESMRVTGAAASEYAKKVREVNAAEKEMNKLFEKTRTDSHAMIQADYKALEAKERLKKAEQQLAKDRESTKFAPDMVNKNLVAKVKELSEAYEKVREEAKKFTLKLETSSNAAGKARQKYEQLRAELAGMRPPLQKAGQSIDTFEQGAKQAGTTVTKLARGFNAVAMMGGAAIPGLAGLGRAISMFAFSGPWVGGAIVGLGALSAAFRKLSAESDKQAQYIHENAERSLKSAQETKKFVSESEGDWMRLGELSGVGQLTNAQNQEATSIIERLTEVYGYLGLEIDATTGKLSGYAEARRKANEQEIAIQKEQLERARTRAEREQKQQLENLEKSTKKSAVVKDSDYFRASNEQLKRMIEDQNTPEIELIKAFNERKDLLERVLAGEEELTFSFQTRNNMGTVFNQTAKVGKGTVSEQLKLVEELEKAWQKANDIKKEYESFNTKPAEEYSKEVSKLAKTLADSENKFTVDANGEKRLKTNEEVYNEQKKQLESFNAEIERLQTGINYDNTKNIENITKLENEKLGLIKETLAYENRVTDEKKRQAEVDRKMNDAAKLLSDTSVNLFNQQGQKLMSMLSDKNASEHDIMDEFDRMIANVEQIKTGKAIVSDYTQFEYIPEQKDFRGTKDARFLGEIDQESAEAYSQTLKKVKADFEALNKEKNRLENLSTLNADDLYNEQKKRIDEITKEIEKETAASLQHIDETAILDNGKQAGIYLKELELERSNLLEKTLTYEQRISEEKKRQTKSLNDAINAEQMRVNTFKSGYITNSKGDLIRSKNTDEIAKDRSEEIKELQALINEKGYGETLEEEKELVAARLKLANLQAEQLKYREQVKSANEKNNDARRYYNFDKNGAVIGKKTEEELNKERQKELEAARERVKASKAGTLERAQAQAELDRLAIEDYNARKKTDSAQMIQHAQGVQSRLMRGVEARSAEALALEARSFRRDDSEKAILKDTKEVQTDIRDTLNKVSETVTNFGAAFLNLNGILQPL